MPCLKLHHFCANVCTCPNFSEVEVQKIARARFEKLQGRDRSTKANFTERQGLCMHSCNHDHDCTCQLESCKHVRISIPHACITRALPRTREVNNFKVRYIHTYARWISCMRAC